ncbi:MAG: hypothetical protein EZS28_006168 [Streblomastix strix]|uniref:Uncharacterized protein n=1 Tax=Streblomastix strix TaxID=222440 RepID=A0A5J4WU36_9EUKA|nr:MAG: hypothetical protein EZS28_006168 [Streblomastix strix]
MAKTNDPHKFKITSRYNNPFDYDDKNNYNEYARQFLDKFIERNERKLRDGLTDKQITNIRPKWIPPNTYDEHIFERLTKIQNTETRLNKFNHQKFYLK